MKRGALNVCISGISAALLCAAKFVLNSVPNVEIVTAFIVLLTLLFGTKRILPSVFAFCLVEGFVFGFGSWLVAYFIHFPGLCLVTGRFSKSGKVWLASLFAVILTVFFGVLTTLTDVLFFTSAQNFFKNFITLYVSGVTFYVTHVISVAVSCFLILPVVFKPLKTVVSKTFALSDDEPKDNENIS